jgi:ribosome recycling factor
MVDEVLKDARERMDKAVEAFRRSVMGVRAGRATPALLEKIRVDYYGTPTPIHQLATISVPEPRLLVIQPWDKSIVGAVERAILKSDLGLTPTSDGAVIRLVVPQLTAERRTELVRAVRKMAEDERVAVRNVRREAKEWLEDLERDGEVSEDEARRGHEDLQRLTDRAVAEIDKILAAKEKEILEV